LTKNSIFSFDLLFSSLHARYFIAVGSWSVFSELHQFLSAPEAPQVQGDFALSARPQSTGHGHL
jgi:hypothetical protein